MNNFKETLKKIKSRGYYTLEFRPTSFKKDLIPDLKTLRNYVDASEISLRGWPFPLIPESNKEFAGIYNSQDCIESWVATDHYYEVWRFYTSGLFVDFNAFNVDWYCESGFTKGTRFEKIEPSKWMDAIQIMYELTEFMLFFANMAEKIDSDNYYIQIILNNVKDRTLTTFDPSRGPLFFRYVSNVNSITWEKEVQKEHLIVNCVDLAKEVIKRVYEQFNWESFSEKLIDDEQKKLIERRL